MKVRVLTEQQADVDLDRESLAAGEVRDLPKEWASDLLNRADAEPIAEKPSSRAERRPAAKRAEKRG